MLLILSSSVTTSLLNGQFFCVFWLLAVGAARHDTRWMLSQTYVHKHRSLPNKFLVVALAMEAIKHGTAVSSLMYHLFTKQHQSTTTMLPELQHTEQQHNYQGATSSTQSSSQRWVKKVWSVVSLQALSYLASFTAAQAEKASRLESFAWNCTTTLMRCALPEPVAAGFLASTPCHDTTGSCRSTVALSTTMEDVGFVMKMQQKKQKSYMKILMNHRQSLPCWI